jgi:hypothetical protein
METFFGLILATAFFALAVLAGIFAFAVAGAVFSGPRPLEKGILAFLAAFFLFE